MARTTSAAADPDFVRCDHHWIDGPGSTLLCEPRLVLIGKLNPAIMEKASAARADHAHDGTWPGTLRKRTGRA